MGQTSCLQWLAWLLKGTLPKKQTNQIPLDNWARKVAVDEFGLSQRVTLKTGGLLLVSLYTNRKGKLPHTKKKKNKNTPISRSITPPNNNRSQRKAHPCRKISFAFNAPPPSPPVPFNRTPSRASRHRRCRPAPRPGPRDGCVSFGRVANVRPKKKELPSTDGRHLCDLKDVR